MENLQLLSVIVVEMCFYVGWGRFALGSLKKLAGIERGKKYSINLLVLSKCIAILCLAVFVYSKLVLFKELGF